MKLTQENLQKVILGVMVTVVLISLVVFREFGNLTLSIFLAVVIAVWPFWLGSLVRYRLTPYLDSLNELIDEDGLRRRSTENFPLWMRVLIWAFVGVVFGLFWTLLVPAIFSLHLWLGRTASAIGWKSLFQADGVWQYGWLIVFVVQYLINFVAGFISSNDSEFNERFEYPDE